MLRFCVIFDLDGTLADNRHRLHYLEETPKNWPAFFDACVHDTVHKPVHWLYHVISQTAVSTVICSGRPSSHHMQTVSWLAKHDIEHPDHLLMRKVGDHRPDTTVKKEMLSRLSSLGYAPLLAIDDRPDVVRMWRAEGIPCLQVNDATWYEPTSNIGGDCVKWLEWMSRQHASPMYKACAEELRELRSLKFALRVPFNDLPCTLSHGGKCVAKTSEACVCKSMPMGVYTEALAKAIADSAFGLLSKGDC